MPPLPASAAGVVPASRPRGSFALRDVALFALAWIAMIVVSHPRGDFPINDDWVYAAAARSVLQGRFEIYSWSSANVGPLAYWGALFAWLFGFSFDVLRLSTQVLGLVTVIVVYFLFVEVWRDRAIAAFAAWMLLVDPLYFALANTFMTDVPFLACFAASMLSVIAGMRRERVGLVVLGVVIALVGVLMRQFAIVLLCGFAVAYVAWRGLGWRHLAVALAPLVFGLLLNQAFTDWLVASGRKPYPAGIPTLLTAVPEATAWRLRSSLFAVVSYVGLLTIPMAIVCLPAWRGVAPRVRIAVWSALGLLSAVLAVAFVTRRLTVPLNGNTFWWYGIGPLTNADTLIDYRNLPVQAGVARVAWIGITAAAIVASALVLVALGRGGIDLGRALRRPLSRPRATPVVIALYGAGCGAAYLVILLLVALHYELFDRYLLPLALLAGLALPLATLGAHGRPASSPARRMIATVVMDPQVNFGTTL